MRTIMAIALTCALVSMVFGCVSGITDLLVQEVRWEHVKMLTECPDNAKCGEDKNDEAPSNKPSDE